MRTTQVLMLALLTLAGTFVPQVVGVAAAQEGVVLETLGVSSARTRTRREPDRRSRESKALILANLADCGTFLAPSLAPTLAESQRLLRLPLRPNATATEIASLQTPEDSKAPLPNACLLPSRQPPASEPPSDSANERPSSPPWLMAKATSNLAAAAPRAPPAAASTVI